MANNIEVENLVKRYGDFTAVDDVTFTVAEGDFFGFLGPNGAGKTTTMRILATLLRKTTGQVRVAGFDVDREPDPIRHAIGFAMQDISLDNLASGYENLQLLGVLYGLTPAQARTRADELLEVVGLSKVAKQWVNQYSGGMRRRLDLAGVLMHSPKILFLDEPTQGLDPQARRIIWDYLRSLNADGSTIFLTTHYMDEADVLCRDLAFIDHGKIIQRGTPAELKAQMGGDLVTLHFAPGADLENIRRIVDGTLGTDGAALIKDDGLTLTSPNAGELAPRLIATLDSAQSPPIAMNISKPSLEDVFVKLVGRSILDDDVTLVKGRDPFVEGRR